MLAKSDESSSALAFLSHKEGDSVAIAVRDVEPGTGSLAVLGADGRRQITVAEPIPLGHKIALVDLAENTPVIEYGEPVGLACQDIAAGELVHIHNMRSAKWQLSA